LTVVKKKKKKKKKLERGVPSGGYTNTATGNGTGLWPTIVPSIT
jgi:hypothetical protein